MMSMHLSYIICTLAIWKIIEIRCFNQKTIDRPARKIEILQLLQAIFVTYSPIPSDFDQNFSSGPVYPITLPIWAEFIFRSLKISMIFIPSCGNFRSNTFEKIDFASIFVPHTAVTHAWRIKMIEGSSPCKILPGPFCAFQTLNCEYFPICTSISRIPN